MHFLILTNFILSQSTMWAWPLTKTLKQVDHSTEEKKYQYDKKMGPLFFLFHYYKRKSSIYFLFTLPSLKFSLPCFKKRLSHSFYSLEPIEWPFYFVYVVCFIIWECLQVLSKICNSLKDSRSSPKQLL